jgi:hypothetical protein
LTGAAGAGPDNIGSGTFSKFSRLLEMLING